ncbi:hypothetical protein EST38_g11095 [Candolleomyces aberdarensis]|uniref:pyranose dehydrogenase (acceptor) n=1 Tax=Candolleomyces aberdarensis TaxID=2316362 RepID=A0A4Q2D812_9AGAR|nr:hypothetical protein EST38_g11095 [Candolleomyces aberdarensis]
MGKLTGTLVGLIALSASLVHGRVLEDLEQLDSAKQSYDFVIVGGGIGGSTVASRLSANPRFNVLLIEAGPTNDGVTDIAVPAFFGRINSTYSWGHVTTPQIGLNNRSLPYNQARVLGGSSSHNGMNEKLVPPPGGRNASGQYDPRFHAIKNAEQSEEIKFNLDVNSGKPSGLVWVQSTIGNGERCSAAVGVLGGQVKERPNLTILLNTQATRVLPSKKSRQLEIRTVEIVSISSGKKTTVTAKKELIVSAGAFGTPHLLLNSGIGDRKELEDVKVKSIHHLPDVGKGLSDHFGFQLSLSANGVVRPVDTVAALAEWQTNRTGPLTEALGHQLMFARIPPDAPLFKEHRDPAAGANSPHIEIIPFSLGTQVLAYVGLLTPKSRGTVKIASNNPLDKPLIDLGYLTHPFDLLAFKEGARIAKRWYEGPPYEGYITGFLGPDPDTLPEKEFDDALKAGAATWWHPVGTASISPKGAKHGVLDPELKVKGVKGLRVVDASAIPYVPTAHTQAAVYVLAERASDLIKASW